MLQAMLLLDRKGATLEDVDKAMQLGAGIDQLQHQAKYLVVQGPIGRDSHFFFLG